MISCDCGYEWDGDGWMWLDHTLMVMHVTDRRKPCRCCGDLINFGEEVFRFSRMRAPITHIEERILGEEVWLSPWYTCEECSDLISAVEDLGFCWNWGESIAAQIAQYREAEREMMADPEKSDWASVEDYL